MAKGKKTGGRNFTKGNKAAKGKGRLKHTELVKETRRLTQREWIEEATFLAIQPMHFIAELARDWKNQTFVRASLASLMLNIVNEGDYKRLEMLLNRIHGRVPLAVSVSRGPDHPFQRLLSELTEQDLEIMRNKVLKSQSRKAKEHVVDIENAIEVSFERSHDK